MFKRFQANSLFLFLTLSLLFIVLIVPNKMALIFPERIEKTNAIVTAEQISYTPQGEVDKAEIRLFNDAFDLYYSLDGGKTFQMAETGILNPLELENPGIMYKRTSIRWRHPNGSFPALHTLVLKVKDKADGSFSAPKTLTYFKPIETKLPIVSLTVNETNLFDWKKGMMILGAASMKNEGFYKNWWFRSANFAERDRSTIADFQYFENGILQLDDQCKLKISGNATRYFPQKSMKLSPANPHIHDKFDYPFWGENGLKKCESLVLRNAGNDNVATLFADLLMHKLADSANVLVQKGFPVNVFINGNYWGIYNLRERIDDYFIAKNEGKKKSDVTILQCEGSGYISLLKDGKEEEKETFDSLIATLRPTEKLGKEEYERIKEHISIKSFIDYILIECYFANQDWPHNNVIWYKADHKKWKWLLNDLDLSLMLPGAYNLESNLFDKLNQGNSIIAKLFCTLMQSKNFKEKLKSRAVELVENTFSEAVINAVYLSLKQQYEKDIDRQINRWKFMGTRSNWEANCESNRIFLLKRRILFLKQVEEL